MSSYCCFINPENDYSEKKLEDIAPSGYAYGFPLFNPPDRIGDYKILKPLSRGFYSTTYIVQDILLQKKVLKVIPKRVYEHFDKNFEEECILHARIAQDTDHIVGINSRFDSTVVFSNKIELDCHVAVLDYVEGPSLKEIMQNAEIVSASRIAQIAIDLFELLIELENKKINHNDLKAGNIIVKTLNEGNKRGEAIYNYLKVIAIDLGSLLDHSKSDFETQRIGDLHQIASYLKVLSLKLLEKPEQTNDNEYRLAMLLDDQARMISPKVEYQTKIHFSDAISMIKDTFRRTYFPWKDQLKLKSFSDYYNAQTLQPWYVPSLLVDPDNNWINQISNRGPLLITGMRGCGKTMLLKALQFHARAMPANSGEGKNPDLIFNRLNAEGYIGLYVSCTKLLDKLGKPSEDPLVEPFSRLFIAYAIEAIKSIRHLYDINKDNVELTYYKIIKSAIFNLIQNNDVLENVNSDSSLENCLIDILSSLNKGENKYVISVSPTIAFSNLSEAIKKCSVLWNNHYVLFLLDDVSTRYFYEQNISFLLSSLIFQSENCAFKITSEGQTIEMLYSPGKIEQARPGRDLIIFDLGKNVYDKIRGEKDIRKGIAFLEKILQKRAKYYSSHPIKIKPSILLGNKSLTSIARNICKLSENHDDKNRIYHGISALAGICVGDIGEVIDLYESILNNFNGKIPIDIEKQSQCFRDLSSIRLFQLNRLIRSNINLKDYALSFAEAAHELLTNSYKYTPTRLRQYYSIYIKITSGTNQEQEVQFRKVIELIDAGIFVFAGGSISPRTIKADRNPTKQFVLIYRKIYGITNMIGLQQADRIELKAERLKKWLENPKDGKEILMEGLGNIPLTDGEKNKRKKKEIIKKIEDIKAIEAEPDLFDALESSDKVSVQENGENELFLSPKINIIKEPLFSKIPFDLLLTGLGFEERAFSSIKEIVKKNSNIKKAICIKYKEKGYSDDILEFLNSQGIKSQCINYTDIVNNLKIPKNSNILCNISGLPMNVIYLAINKSIKLKSKLCLSHTYAKTYFPTNEDIENFIKKYSESEVNYDYLQNITADLVKGESGPYEIINLLNANSDELKRRVLFAFSSPKYERLFKIIDEREFDIIELISPPADHPRNKLANIAAKITSKRFNFVKINNFDSNNIQDLLKFLIAKYYEYYINQNYNIEFALTGSKRQAIVSSAICSLFKVSKCWYVRPTIWDTEHFSKGSKSTSFFNVEIIRK